MNDPTKTCQNPKTALSENATPVLIVKVIIRDKTTNLNIQ